MVESEKYQQFVDQMSLSISNTLRSFQAKINEPIKMIALDYHPWNGFMGIALLTERETKMDPMLDDVREMAAWEYYNFGDGMNEWMEMDEMCGEMKNIYEKEHDSDELFRCCAAAMASSLVQQSVHGYSLSDGFRISVAHPDDGREYFDAHRRNA